jgi:hypothetical protein
MTKVEMIRDYLRRNPNATTRGIAETLECSNEHVRRIKNGTYYTPRKNAKEAAIARNAELGKRAKRK